MGWRQSFAALLAVIDARNDARQAPRHEKKQNKTEKKKKKKTEKKKKEYFDESSYSSYSSSSSSSSSCSDEDPQGHFKLLGVSTNASLADIKAAYFAKRRQYDPDTDKELVAEINK